MIFLERIIMKNLKFIMSLDYLFLYEIFVQNVCSRHLFRDAYEQQKGNGSLSSNSFILQLKNFPWNYLSLNHKYNRLLLV